MKRKNNLYKKIIDKNNIRQAILTASKKKKTRKSVLMVLDNINMYVEKIHAMLETETYIPSKYHKMVIHDGVNKKERIIYKPNFYPDQIVHWALMLQIEPILLKGMYCYCCGSIRGRGISYGAKHMKKILVTDRKNTKYCLKLDIKKFYPSIDKEILKKKFRHIIKERETLNLIDIIIDSSEQGVPIRKLYKSVVCKFLFTRLGSLHQRTIAYKILY